MKKIILLLLLSAALFTVQAQRYTPYIKFTEPTQSIGDIHEEKGCVTIKYHFSNIGAKPLIINSTNTSTTRIKITFPKKPILPKGEGDIIVTYTPKNKKGEFNRTITVMSNAKNRISVLRLSGKVIPRPLTIEEKYPTIVGDIRYKRNSNRITFNDIKNTESKTDTVYLMNYSDSIKTLEFIQLSDYITVKPAKLVLQPKEKSIIQVSYDASKKHDYGYTYERIQLSINGKHKYRNDLSLNARIIEDFSKLSKKELAKAPKVTFETTRFEFGTIIQGEKSKHIFKFKNEGKQDLLIRKIKASCGCTAVTSGAKIIKGGESSQIEVTFNSSNKRGRQHKFIHIICNDPINHTIKLEVIGNIKMPVKS